MPRPSEHAPRAPFARRKIPRWVRKTLADSTLIVFSILLALAADGWWEERENLNRARRSLVTFEHEIQQNRADLSKLLPYHRTLERSFSHAATTHTVRSVTDWHRIEGWAGGFHPAFLLDTAWKTALATGVISHLDYETVAALSRVYVLQERLDAYNRSTLSTMDPTDVAMASTVQRASVYLQDVTTYEELLLREYEAALARIHRHVPAAAVTARHGPGQGP
ncbi:MAG TPA: hypothetical protein VF584_20370 [Longimicrobium sp.]